MRGSTMMDNCSGRGEPLRSFDIQWMTRTAGSGHGNAQLEAGLKALQG